MGEKREMRNNFVKVTCLAGGVSGEVGLKI